MVDVGAGAGDASVVEDLEGIGGELVEARTELFFAGCPCCPGGCGLGVVGESEDEAADFGVFASDGVFAALAASFVFAAC